MTQLTYNIWIHVGGLKPFQHLSAATGRIFNQQNCGVQNGQDDRERGNDFGCLSVPHAYLTWQNDIHPVAVRNQVCMCSIIMLSSPMHVYKYIYIYVYVVFIKMKSCEYMTSFVYVFWPFIWDRMFALLLSTCFCCTSQVPLDVVFSVGMVPNPVVNTKLCWWMSAKNGVCKCWLAMLIFHDMSRLVNWPLLLS